MGRFAILAVFLMMASPAHAWGMHPADGPWAEAVITVNGREITYLVTINAEFVDVVQGFESSTPDRAPGARELAAMRAWLERDVARNTVVLADGVALPAVFGNFESAPPRPELIAMIAPEQIRMLTQMRFTLRYEVPENARRVVLGWGYYPDHPKYEVPGSPLVPLEVKALLDVEGEHRVLTFTEDAQTCVLRDAPAARAYVKTASFPWWSAVAGALAVVALVFLKRKRTASLLPMLVVGALLTACDGEGAPDAKAAKAERGTNHESLAGSTDRWAVEILPSTVPVPNNEYFSMTVKITSRTGALRPARVHVDADMPEHKHGMNTKPEIRHHDGAWHVDGMLFHMPGYWEIYVFIGEGDDMERVVVPVTI